MSAEATEASIDGAVDSGTSVPLDQMTATFLTETLGAILKSAQDSVAEMVRRAQAMSEEKVAESRRVHANLQEEYERFRSWRAEIQPLLDANRGRAETVQADVEQTIGRLRDAIKPLTDEMSAMEQAMSDFLGATPPPIPPALDLGRSENPPAPVVDTPAAPPEAPSSGRSAFDTMWALPGSPEPATAEPATAEPAVSEPEPGSEPAATEATPEPEPEPPPEPAASESVPTPAVLENVPKLAPPDPALPEPEPPWTEPEPAPPAVAPPEPDHAPAPRPAPMNGAPEGAPEDKGSASYAWVNDGRKFKVLASESVSDGAGGDVAGAADGEIPAPADVPSTDASPRKNDPKAEGWVPKRAEEIDWSDLPGLDRDR